VPITSASFKPLKAAEQIPSTLATASNLWCKRSHILPWEVKQTRHKHNTSATVMNHSPFGEKKQPLKVVAALSFSLFSTSRHQLEDDQSRIQLSWPAVAIRQSYLALAGDTAIHNTAPVCAMHLMSNVKEDAFQSCKFPLSYAQAIHFPQVVNATPVGRA
jgi:hypothetical protein